MHKQPWSVFRVEKGSNISLFKHGHNQILKIPACFMERDAIVQVFRRESLFDEGKVEEMGGHDGSLRFSKLDKIVPSSAKWYRKIPFSTGVTDPLLPVWFEDGDVVRIQVASATFRSCMRIWPEYWK